MSLSLQAAAAVLALASVARAVCRYPDGSDVTSMGYAPCAGEMASCCVQHPSGVPDTCLSNGLCYSEIRHYVYQGACNDEWGSDRCPKYCLNDNTKSFKRLSHCKGNEYCCSGEDCCEKPKEVFDIGTPCVEEYIALDHEPNASNSTASPPTMTTRVAVRSSSCTPWSHSHPPPDSNSPNSDNSGGSLLGRNFIIFTVLGCLGILLILLVVVYYVRRTWSFQASRGPGSSKARQVHSTVRDFGKRIMGRQVAFTSIPQKPYEPYQGYMGEKSFRDSFSSASATSDSGSISVISSPSVNAGQRSPQVEMEPMLTPEPAKTRQGV